MAEQRETMIAGGDGACAKCGARLLVLDPALGRLLANFNPNAPSVLQGTELDDGRLVVVADPDNVFRCPRCETPGIFTAISPN